MNNNFLFVFLAFLFFNLSSAQIVFEPGYFIDNNNTKVYCLIRNLDWKNNPTDFEYKLTEDSKVEKGTLQSIKEFEVEGESKFIRAEVKIDISSDNSKSYSYEKDPIFKKETVFLKVLIEGKGSLYVYESSGMLRYFCSVNESPITQLIYKHFIDSSDGLIKTNNSFRQQLYLLMRDDIIDQKVILSLNHNKDSFVGFFRDFNTVNNTTFKDYTIKPKRDLINLSVRPRFTTSTIKIDPKTSSFYKFDFETQNNLALGIEFELVLPFNRNKWALVIEPTYQSFKAESRSPIPNLQNEFFIGNVNYSSLELPVSVRHYLFLNKNSKVFLNISYVPDFILNGTFEVKSTVSEDTLEKKDFDSTASFGFGFGYKYQNRYSIEFRHYTNREMFKNDFSVESTFTSSSIIIGYTIF